MRNTAENIILQDSKINLEVVINKIIVIAKEVLYAPYHNLIDKLAADIVVSCRVFEENTLNKFSYKQLVSKCCGTNIRTEIHLTYAASITKVILFQLHFDGLIVLDYENIGFLTNSSDILYKFLLKTQNLSVPKEEFSPGELKILYPLLLKNRINSLEMISDKMIKEFYDYALSIEGNRRSTKYSAQYVWTLWRTLFLKGFINIQPRISNSQDISNAEYFAGLRHQQLKNAIEWFFNTNGNLGKKSISKYRKELLYFGGFIDKYFPQINISDIDMFVARKFKNILNDDLEEKKIPSKNWASICVSRVNSFVNFLFDQRYRHKPIALNLFLPNIFDDRSRKSKRDIPQYLIPKIIEEAKKIGEYEWALIKIYEGTGMRINELSVLSLGNYHQNAKEHLCIDAPEIRDDICSIKVISPKILDIERIVLADSEVYKALKIIENHRNENFKDVPRMLHPVYPRLGKREYLILNTFGLPYSSLGSKISSILERINVSDEEGNLIQITTHQFRHTYVTKLREAGVPIHMIMDNVGHVSPAMNDWYGEKKVNTNEIIYQDNLIDDDSKIELNYLENQIVLEGKIINQYSNLYAKHIKRGGYCLQDEFQEKCVDIDCIECPFDKFKTNKSFAKEIEKTQHKYLREWASETNKVSDKAIHYLCLSRYYEEILKKVLDNADKIEVALSKEEKEKISLEVGM